MRISNYGVDLISMTESDLELVRTWRNQADVASYMFVTTEITTEEHRNWFKSLSTNDVYLIIQVKGKPIGVINVKQIDWNERTGEAGIFIGEQSFRNSPIAMQAIFALMDAFFLDFQFKTLKATVKSTNANAIDFNQDLGYHVVAENGEQINMLVTQEQYLLAKTRFDVVLRKTCTSSPQIDLSEFEQTLFETKV